MPKKPRRGRGAPSEPSLTSPLPQTPSPLGGSGDVDSCIKLDLENRYHHDHHHHTTTRGLIEHIRDKWGHNQAARWVRDNPLDLILEVLDDAAELHDVASPIAWAIAELRIRKAERAEDEAQSRRRQFRRIEGGSQ